MILLHLMKCKNFKFTINNYKNFQFTMIIDFYASFFGKGVHKSFLSNA